MQGLRPVLAGRSAGKLQSLATELGLDYRAFGLGQPDTVKAGLAGIDRVMHCAGPFSATSAPMVEGCLAFGAHCLDMTGEVAVFEHIHRLRTRTTHGHVYSLA